jgi:predicted nuclease of predicted toxin-antitoxin system
LAGADDERLGAVWRAHARVLFTLDLDFADIRTYPPADYTGIVVMRPSKPSRDGVLTLLTRALPVLAREWAEHHLWIVEPSRIRTRGSGR